MKKKILVADDEAKILKMVKNRLKANHYDVVTAEDGEDALKKAKQNKIDLFILDMAMPKLNGYQVCRVLRSDEGFKNIPIIILSAWVREKAGEDTELANVYVAKPFEAEHLMSEIRNLIGPGK